MIEDTLPWLPSLPVVVPLLLACLVVAMPGPRSIAAISMLGLAVAAIPLLALEGMPRTSPAWQWATLDGAPISFQLSLDADPSRPLFAFLLLAAGATGLWSVARLLSVDDEEHGWRSMRSPRAACAGLLVIVAGGQVAVLAVTPLLAVLGLGIMALGSLLVSMVGAVPVDDAPVPAAAPLFLGLALLLTAAFVDATLRATAQLWVAGLVVLLVAEPMRLPRDRAPLILGGVAQVIGVAPVTIVLLLPSGSNSPIALDAAPAVFEAVGLAAFVLGALNAVAARGLRGVITSQWIAQLGVALLAIATVNRGAVESSLLPVAALANAILSTLLISLMAGRLALVVRGERIADLPPPPTSLTRCGMAYAIGAASAAGLPLTLGFGVRRSIITGAAPSFVEPFLLAGSSLLLLALAAPMAGFFRRPARALATPASIDRVVGATPLLALALVVGGLYGALEPFVADDGLAGLLALELPALLRVGANLAAVLLILVLAARALRRVDAGPVWHAGLVLDEEPGWPLPFAALAGILAPFTPAPWIALYKRAWPWAVSWFAQIGAAERIVERRYYLGLIVLATISIVLVATGGSGS